MGLKRKEIDKVRDELHRLYRRKSRDAELNKGIDIMYNALLSYIDGKEIKRDEQ